MFLKTFKNGFFKFQTRDFLGGKNVGALLNLFSPLVLFWVHSYFEGGGNPPTKKTKY